MLLALGSIGEVLESTLGNYLKDLLTLHCLCLTYKLGE